MTSGDSPRQDDDRPFALEVSYRCPACGARSVVAAVRAEPGCLRLPRTVTCGGCGNTENHGARPGRGTLTIVGV